MPGVSFGAAVTLSNVLSTCSGIAAAAPKGQKCHMAAIARHLQLVAHPMVRDVASWYVRLFASAIIFRFFGRISFAILKSNHKSTAYLLTCAHFRLRVRLPPLLSRRQNSNYDGVLLVGVVVVVVNTRSPLSSPGIRHTSSARNGRKKERTPIQMREQMHARTRGRVDARTRGRRHRRRPGKAYVVFDNPF